MKENAVTDRIDRLASIRAACSSPTDELGYSAAPELELQRSSSSRIGPLFTDSLHRGAARNSEASTPS